LASGKRNQLVKKKFSKSFGKRKGELFFSLFSDLQIIPSILIFEMHRLDLFLKVLISVLGTGPQQGDMTIEGEFEIGSQYHFHMETQSCLVTPSENGQVNFNK